MSDSTANLLFFNRSELFAEFFAVLSPSYNYFVTLKTRNSRTQRRTDTPKGGIIPVLVSSVSDILPITTKQSNRLNSETKYP